MECHLLHLEHLLFLCYGGSNAARGNLGLHRLIEALKHMWAVRMNLGDPNFVNIDDTISKMLSPSFAKDIQHMILDNTTFPPEYYMNRWSQLSDHGTSHMCIVDADRNAVSLTTTVNYHFGAGFRSTSTGILVNNEMDDFSTPTDISPDKLPPAPANFIEPNKRPLSSMTPLIVTKDDQLVGVLGGSGGMNIIAAVVQVFLNHFILGMKPLDAVVSPRIYHKLIPNVVRYENLTAHNGDHIELSKESRLFLEERGHQLRGSEALAVTQLIVQTLKTPMNFNRKVGENTKSLTKHGTLTAVSDPRKGGCPAAV
ncbi:glutathione hydrolase 3 isoform X2 [Glycine max]|uniref:glutathione hydrolase 3 isoform X2 n=1 Tax=Glycine max TaxID=3847 RepID=UPI001B356CF4|nr:glutathione hydrolase 3 isoform X2 [Glycine max]